MSEERAKGLSRRQLLGTGVVAGVAAALEGCGPSGAPATPAASAQAGGAGAAATGGEELVLVNGRIHTMDRSSTVAKSVSIRDGRFTAINASPARGARVIDLRGRTVVPGIIDNHNHIILMGNRPGYHTPLENALSIADVQQTVSARAKGIPAGGWITTIGGFHRNHLVAPSEMPRLPTLAELDAAAPNNPVFLCEGFLGPSVTNSAGKKFFESRTPAIPVAADGGIAAAGKGTGAALLALRQTLLTADQRRRGAIDAINYGLSLGVTMHIDQGAFEASNTPGDGAAHENNYTMQLPFLALHAEGKLPARIQINFLHQDGTPELTTLRERVRNTFPFFGDDMLRTGGIGEFIGGPKSFRDAAIFLAQSGWRAEVHSLSATDFQQEIQDYEAAHKVASIAELRWVVAHVPFITEDYVNRLKAIGGGLSLTSWRYLAGTEKQNGPPFKMIVSNGIPTGMSSDGMQIAPMNPWIHMYYAVTGMNARGVLINGGQTISRNDALKLYTANNAWFLRMDNQIGTIEPGRLADVAVLSGDFLTVPDPELKRIRSVLTVVDGKIVYDAGAL